MQRSLPDFERENIAVFAISYDSVPVLQAFTERNGISYPLLSDEGSVVIRDLGLLNIHLAEQSAAYGLTPRPEHQGVPYPGTFLLDEQGIIVEKRFHQSYRERETGVAVLEQGFGSHGSSHGAEVTAATGDLRVHAVLDSPTYRYHQRLWLTLEVSIAPGLHVFGRPIPEGYTPFTVEVAPLDGLIAGRPDWPEPRPFTVAGLDEQFTIYEGDLRLSLPVTFTKRQAGDQTLTVTIGYQACSETDCRPPTSLTLELPVQEAAHVPAPSQP